LFVLLERNKCALSHEGELAHSSKFKTFAIRAAWLMGKRLSKLPAHASWKHFGGTGVRAHFYHATGFPAGVYTPLLSRLSKKFHLSALDFRATWPGIGAPPEGKDYWQRYADDLIVFIEQELKEPVIGMGHSMGATCTILAAVKRPDLFTSLVLIEPAMVSRTQARLIRLVPKAVMGLIEPAKGTLRKRDRWPSRDAFLNECRQNKLYKRLGDEAFSALAQYGVIDDGSGQFRLGKVDPSVKTVFQLI